MNDYRSGEEYWSMRAESEYTYKGEKLYTVTSPVLYLRRRALLLEFSLPYLKRNDVQRICDFGCGDGWYMAYFRDRLPDRSFSGLDLSPQMVEISRRRNPNAIIEVSASGIAFEREFDLIYCFAVLAHVEDEIAIVLIQNISDYLAVGGHFLLFEQTGRYRKRRGTYCQRLCSDYESWGKTAGVSLESRTTISYPVFRLYETTLLRVFRLLFPGRSPHEKCINSNRSAFVNKVSEAMLSISGPGVSRSRCENGNTLFVFRKVAHNTMLDGMGTSPTPRYPVPDGSRGLN